MEVRVIYELIWKLSRAYKEKGAWRELKEKTPHYENVWLWPGVDGEVVSGYSDGNHWYTPDGRFELDAFTHWTPRAGKPDQPDLDLE
jgi:hypothetical protein